MLLINTILVPTDFSAAAAQALNVAQSLARDHQAKLVLFGAAVPTQPTAEVLVPLPTNLTSGSPVTAWPHAENAVRRQLLALAATISDVPVETDACVGSPGDSIVSAAQEHLADLIVMGTHGRSGVSRMLLGSVAEHVLRHAPCPVLTIKTGTEGRLHPPSPGHMPATV